LHPRDGGLGKGATEKERGDFGEVTLEKERKTFHYLLIKKGAERHGREKGAFTALRF